MGQNASAQHTRDTIIGEQFRQFCDMRQGVTNRAFKMCVTSPIKEDSTHELSNDERNCVEEYAALYTGFVKIGFMQFTQLYEMHQRDMYEKARMEAMQSQARSEIGRK